MAAAYGALVSLLNDLVDIQNHPQHSFSFDSNQIQSLRESVNFLIDFMESYDNCHGPSKEAAQLLEMRITRAAYEAEEVIESHLVDQIRDGKTETPDLHEIIEGVDCVRREAVEVQAQAQSGLKLKQQPINSAAAASSSTPMFTSEKNSMVGFDEVLLRLLDLLTGKPSSQRVIPIVGTGGIEGGGRYCGRRRRRRRRQAALWKKKKAAADIVEEEEGDGKQRRRRRQAALWKKKKATSAAMEGSGGGGNRAAAEEQFNKSLASI